MKKEQRDEHGDGNKDGFQYMSLRPGWLTDEPPTGKVELGKTSKAYVQIPRGDVAAVATELLAVEGAKGWYDVVSGEEEEEIEKAVARVMRERITSMEGERLEEMEGSLEGV